MIKTDLLTCDQDLVRGGSYYTLRTQQNVILRRRHGQVTKVPGQEYCQCVFRSKMCVVLMILF